MSHTILLAIPRLVTLLSTSSSLIQSCYTSFGTRVDPSRFVPYIHCTQQHAAPPPMVVPGRIVPRPTGSYWPFHGWSHSYPDDVACCRAHTSPLGLASSRPGLFPLLDISRDFRYRVYDVPSLFRVQAGQFLRAYIPTRNKQCILGPRLTYFPSLSA